MGRCIADCTKDRLVSNIADTKKVSPLVQKIKRGLIVMEHVQVLSWPIWHISHLDQKYNPIAWVWVWFGFHVVIGILCGWSFDFGSCISSFSMTVAYCSVKIKRRNRDKTRQKAKREEARPLIIFTKSQIGCYIIQPNLTHLRRDCRWPRPS